MYIEDVQYSVNEELLGRDRRSDGFSFLKKEISLISTTHSRASVVEHKASSLDYRNISFDFISLC